jgi:hypothetical protein
MSVLGFFTARRLRILLLWAAGLLAVFTLTGFFLIPPIL